MWVESYKRVVLRLNIVLVIWKKNAGISEKNQRSLGLRFRYRPLSHFEKSLFRFENLRDIDIMSPMISLLG